MADVIATWLDGDGYPTDAALDRIKAWPVEDANGVLDFIRSLWWMDGWGVSEELRPEEAQIIHAEEGERYLRLATGGWSGNESLIAALDENMLGSFMWQMSARGGLHIYQYLNEAGTRGPMERGDV